MAAEHYEVPPSLQRVAWLNGQHLKPMQAFEALTNKLGWDYNHRRPQVVWQRGCEVRLDVGKVRRIRGHASHHHPVRGPSTVTTTVQMGTYLTFYLERGCSSVARCSLVLDGVQDVHGKVPCGHHDEHRALRTRILVTRVDTGRVHPKDDEQPDISTQTATPIERTSTATDHTTAASMDKVKDSPAVAASVRTLSGIRSKQRRKLQKNSKNSSKWAKNLRQSPSEKPSGSTTKHTNAYKYVDETGKKDEDIPTSKTSKFYTPTPDTSAQKQIKKNYGSVLDYTSLKTISSTCVDINTLITTQYSPHENISNISLNTRDKEHTLTSYNTPHCPETLDPLCQHSSHSCTTTPPPQAGTDLAITARHVSDWSVEVDLSCHDEVTTVLSDDSGEDEWQDDEDDDIQKVVRKCVTVNITCLLHLPSGLQAYQGHREHNHNTHATPRPVIINQLIHNTMQRNCTLQTDDGATERITKRITDGEQSKGKEGETAIECLHNERNKEALNISCEKGICPRYQKQAPFSTSSNNNNTLLLPLQQSLLSSLDKQSVHLLCNDSTSKIRNDKYMNIRNYSMNFSIDTVSNTNNQADDVVKHDHLQQEMSKNKSIFYTKSSVNIRAPAQHTVAPESSMPQSVMPSGPAQGRELRPQHLPATSRDRQDVKDRDLTPDRGELLVLLLQPRAPQQAWQFQTAYAMVWYNDSGGPDGGSKCGTTSRRLKRRTHLNYRRTVPCRAGAAGASARHDDAVTTLLTTTSTPTFRHDDTTTSDALPTNEGTPVTIWDRTDTVKHESPSFLGAQSTERDSVFSVRDTASLLEINSPQTTSSALTHFNAVRNKNNNLKRRKNIVGVNS